MQWRTLEFFILRLKLIYLFVYLFIQHKKTNQHLDTEVPHLVSD